MAFFVLRPRVCVVILSAGVIVALPGCGGSKESNPAPESISDKTPGKEEPKTTTPAKFYLDETKYQTVPLGATQSEIEEILGPGSAEPPQGTGALEMNLGKDEPKPAYVLYWWNEKNFVAIAFSKNRVAKAQTMLPK